MAKQNGCPNCKRTNSWVFVPPIWVSSDDDKVKCPSCGKIYDDDPYKAWLLEGNVTLQGYTPPPDPGTPAYIEYMINKLFKGE